MAELSPRDRLQPFLLDRLSDDQPQTRVEGRDRRVFSPKQIQASIMRDIAWLLNARAHPEADGLGELAEVNRSVLNFGIPDLTGLTASGLNLNQLERAMVEALRNFEPRIAPHTLSVKAVEVGEAGGPNRLAFEIRGEIIANPMPEPLYVKTEVDLESGLVTLREQNQ